MDTMAAPKEMCTVRLHELISGNHKHATASHVYTFVGTSACYRKSGNVRC